MKGTKKLVKKHLDKQKLSNHSPAITKNQKKYISNKDIKLQQSKIINPVDPSKNHQTSTCADKPNKVYNYTEFSITQIKKSLSKSNGKLSRVKSDDKFSKYNDLIETYKKQSHLIDKQIKQNLKQKQQKLINFQNVFILKNNQQAQKKNLSNKQKQIQNKYLQLKDKYREILIQAKKQVNLYDFQRNTLNELKNQHFKDQNQLQLLRNNFFTHKRSPPKKVSVDVQTENVSKDIDLTKIQLQKNELCQKQDSSFKDSQIIIKTSNKKQISMSESIQKDLDQIIIRRRSEKYANLNTSKSNPSKDEQMCQRKQKTQMNWFEIQKKQHINQLRKSQQSDQQISCLKSNASYCFKQKSRISQEKQIKNQTQNDGNKYKSLLPNNSPIQDLHSKRNQKNNTDKDSFNLAKKQIQKIKFYSQIKSFTAIKSVNKSNQKESRIKEQNIKLIRNMSQKSFKSVKRDLFNIKKSQYLNQFRKQIKKELISSNYERINNQQIQKQEFSTNKAIKIQQNFIQVEKDDKGSDVKKNEEKNMKQIIKQPLSDAPQTPILKFYQSRKPISPSSALNKYRFKPSINIL